MAATQAAITVGDRGFLLNIVAWVALISVSLATFIKVAVKFCRIHRLEWDDFYMLGAMVSRISVVVAVTRECHPPRDILWLNLPGTYMTAVAQTIAVTEQVKSGLGRHMAELSKPQVLVLSTRLGGGGGLL